MGNIKTRPTVLFSHKKNIFHCELQPFDVKQFRPKLKTVMFDPEFVQKCQNDVDFLESMH